MTPSNFQPGQRVTYAQLRNGMRRYYAGYVLRVQRKRVVVRIKILNGSEYVTRNIVPRNLKPYHPKGHRR